MEQIEAALSKQLIACGSKDARDILPVEKGVYGRSRSSCSAVPNS